MTYRFLTTKPDSDYARVFIVLRFTFDIRMSVYSNIIANYIQQDTTFLEFIYSYRRSTYFRRFLRPSSGTHNCTCSFRYCQPILLLAATVEEMKWSSISSTVAASFPLFAYLFSISTIHLFLDLPLILIPVGFHYNILLGVLLSSIRIT